MKKIINLICVLLVGTGTAFATEYIPKGKTKELTSSECCEIWKITTGSCVTISPNKTSCTLTANSVGTATVKAYKKGENGSEEECSSYDIQVFEVKINNISSVCDGLSQDIYFDISPTNLNITNITLEAKDSSGGTNFNNPAGMGITFTGSGKNWIIPNARWYENPSDICNKMATYKIGGKYTVNGEEYELEKKDFSVNANAECINGECVLVSWYSGQPVMTKNQQGNTVTFTYTSKGAFNRDIQTVVNIYTLNASQYYSMVVAEENFHSGQYKGVNGSLFDAVKIWNVNAVWNSISGKSYSATSSNIVDSEVEAFNLAFNDYLSTVNDQHNVSIEYFNSIYCDVEAEAKNGINATHLSVLKCAYPDC